MTTPTVSEHDLTLRALRDAGANPDLVDRGTSRLRREPGTAALLRSVTGSNR